MKLLIFCPYYPPHIGGLESHADEFNKHMSESGNEITLFTPRLPANALEEEIKYENVRIIRFPAWEIINNYPLPKFWDAKFWELFKMIWNHKYDFVISRTRFFNTSLLALVYAKIKKVKWIHIEHGSDFVYLHNSFFRSLAKLYDYTFGRMIFNLADKVIANSEASARFVKKIKSGLDVAVIYRGVDIDKIKAIEPDHAVKENHPGQIISYAGRLIDGKGVADLLTAIKQLNDSSVTLFIIGDGSQRKILENLTKSYNIESQVKFWGHQDFKKLISLIKISDIVVNPSYTEGLPTSIIEAAICSKAIIATNVGGTPEIITDNTSGFLVPPNDPSAIMEKLEVLLSNNIIKENFSKKAHAEAIKKFNWQTSITSYKNILQSI